MVGGAAHLPETRMIGIDVDAEPERVAEDVRQLTTQVATHLDLEHPDLEGRVEVVGGYAGPSYGAVTRGVVEAISRFGRLEGLLVDLVYTSKGAAGLIGLIRNGEFSTDDSVLAVHTGGWPSLFAYRAEIEEQLT